MHGLPGTARGVPMLNADEEMINKILPVNTLRERDESGVEAQASWRLLVHVTRGTDLNCTFSCYQNCCERRENENSSKP